MPIRNPHLKSPPPLLCDWAEIKALSSPAGVYRLSALKRYWDTSREGEQSDPEGLLGKEDDTDVDGVSGPDDERFIDSITEEVGERMTALGRAYPFVLDQRNRLSIVEPEDEGGFLYLFCLLLTYCNGREIFSGRWLPMVDHVVRDLFQACSTVAAAGEVRGVAISFGWPRPNDNPPFLKKLKQVYRLFGEGTVVSKPRKGVSPSPKDEEIDIIAWRPRRDRAPGTEYMLGQVASGDNWMSKPLAGKPLENFHRNWFTLSPASASTARGYIFIPHAVPPVDAIGTRRERMDAITVRYGTIIDRLRLPHLAQEGMEFSRQNPTVLIERTEDLGKIREWVIEQIASLHKIS